LGSFEPFRSHLHAILHSGYEYAKEDGVFRERKAGIVSAGHGCPSGCCHVRFGQFGARSCQQRGCGDLEHGVPVSTDAAGTWNTECPSAQTLRGLGTRSACQHRRCGDLKQQGSLRGQRHRSAACPVAVAEDVFPMAGRDRQSNTYTMVGPAYGTDRLDLGQRHCEGMVRSIS